MNELIENVTFEIFRGKMGNFIERKMERGNEISRMLKSYEGALATLKKRMDFLHN